MYTYNLFTFSTAETFTTLQSNYTPIEIKKKKELQCLTHGLFFTARCPKTCGSFTFFFV